MIQISGEKNGNVAFDLLNVILQPIFTGEGINDCIMDNRLGIPNHNQGKKYVDIFLSLDLGKMHMLLLNIGR